MHVAARAARAAVPACTSAGSKTRPRRFLKTPPRCVVITNPTFSRERGNFKDVRRSRESSGWALQGKFP